MLPVGPFPLMAACVHFNPSLPPAVNHEHCSIHFRQAEKHYMLVDPEYNFDYDEE